MQIGYIFKIAVIFLIPFFSVLISLYLGQRYGTYRTKKAPHLRQFSFGSVVSAVFGLLAFILAFTFQIAANHYDSRKSMLLEEVTNIRTAYLRAGLIEEPVCSGTKKLLVDYVDQRVELFRNFSKLGQVLINSQKILDTLWSYAELLAKRDRNSEVYSLYISSINDLVDNFNKRVVVVIETRIPDAVFYVLYIILVFSMLVLGSQFGISGRGSFKINVLVAVVFAVVMLLITALDRPETGLVKINQKPMVILQDQLHGRQVY
jgi:hypothetical protein